MLHVPKIYFQFHAGDSYSVEAPHKICLPLCLPYHKPMTSLEIIFYIWVGLIFIGTLIPLMREQIFWLRAWTYPRLQMLTLIAMTALVLIVMKGLGAWPAQISFAVLALCACLCLYDIYPFTRFARRHVPSLKPGQPHKSISLLVANVLMDNENYDATLDKIKVNDPDIVFLVETNTAWSNALSALERLYPYHCLLPLKDYNGMLFYSKFPILESQERYLVQEHIPSLTFELDVGGVEPLHFYGVHPRPPRIEDDTADLDKELLFIANEAGHIGAPVLVTGDLNDVGWSSTTKQFLRVSGLKDPRRGRGLYNSYNAKNPLVRWPLDHIFVSQHFAVKRMKRLDASGSDHFPILAEFALLD